MLDNRNSIKSLEIKFRDTPMRTVKQVSDLTGISVHMLYYYDKIELLKPSEITDEVTGFMMLKRSKLCRIFYSLRT